MPQCSMSSLSATPQSQYGALDVPPGSVFWEVRPAPNTDRQVYFEFAQVTPSVHVVWLHAVTMLRQKSGLWLIASSHNESGHDVIFETRRTAADYFRICVLTTTRLAVDQVFLFCAAASLSARSWLWPAPMTSSFTSWALCTAQCSNGRPGTMERSRHPKW